MLRLGGLAISETTPLVSSSAAKEESLEDMLKVVSKYANLLVIRHYNDQDALRAVPYVRRSSDQWWIWGIGSIPPRRCWTCIPYSAPTAALKA